MGTVFSPVYSQRTGWVLGRIVDHVAKPITDRDEIQNIADQLEAAARPSNAPTPDNPERPHIVGGQFQSDKYPTCPPGKVPLSVKDPTAQDLLWQYAQRRRAVDAQFAADLEQCLLEAGFLNVGLARESDEWLDGARLIETDGVQMRTSPDYRIEHHDDAFEFRTQRSDGSWTEWRYSDHADDDEVCKLVEAEPTS